MNHSDPETLALTALGEGVATDADLTHLLGCAECAKQLRELRLTAAFAKRAMNEVALLLPDERVWQSISNQLGFAAVPTPPLVASGPPVRLESRGHRPRARVIRFFLVAALVVFFGVIGSIAAVTSQSPRTIAIARLQPLPAWEGASGTATVQILASGDRVVHITSVMPSHLSDVHEVWLTSSESSAPLSLGTLDGLTGSFKIPVGVDLGTYRYVSVSDQPTDPGAGQKPASVMQGILS